MIKKILENIAYVYYPKNIDNLKEKEKYIQSAEYINLSNTLNSFYDYQKNISYLKLTKRLKEIEIFNNFQDTTLLNWEERCVTIEIEILNGLILNKICIHLSFLIPYYVIYLIDNKVDLYPYKWKTLPKQNLKKEQTIFLDTILMLNEIIKESTDYNKMDNSIANHKIKEINFQDIKMGEFKIFNAFFNNEIKFK